MTPEPELVWSMQLIAIASKDGDIEEISLIAQVDGVMFGRVSQRRKYAQMPDEWRVLMFDNKGRKPELVPVLSMRMGVDLVETRYANANQHWSAAPR